MDVPPGRGIPRVNRVWLVTAVALLLTGCGAHKHVVVQAYGVFPATTVAGKATPAACSSDARAFARDAVLLLAHSGAQAAYPADLYYVILREDASDFLARGCSPAYVGTALRARLSPAQRTALVAALPQVFAHLVQSGLAVTQS
jgi:hypothetical protein